MTTRQQDVASLHDDGAGQIPCPKKGLMAIQRCHEFQRETEAAGAACTCAVFRAYSGGEPREGAEAPAKRLCGSQYDVAVEQLTAPTPAPRTRAVADSQRWRAFAAELEGDEDDDNEQEDTMPRTGGRCTKCNKLPPDNTKLRKGLCKDCRESARSSRIAEIREASERAKNEKAQSRAESKTVKPAEKRARGAGRQTVIPAIAEKEIADLRSQLGERDVKIAELERKLEYDAWIGEGIRQGFLPLDTAATMLSLPPKRA